MKLQLRSLTTLNIFESVTKMKSAIRHLFTVFMSASWGFKATEATGCLYVTMKAKPREIVAVELDNKLANRPNSQ